jgi:hypothetical protein
MAAHCLSQVLLLVHLDLPQSPVGLKDLVPDLLPYGKNLKEEKSRSVVALLLDLPSLLLLKLLHSLATSR